MTDHLAELFFSPVAAVGHGTYRPGRFDLRLQGDAGIRDRLVHYHEAQHVTLTAGTAWGAALLVAAEVPGWEELFARLLDRCRATHESFATYLSCSVIEARHGSPDTALAAYPDYAALAARLNRFLSPLGGAQRRALAMTAMARACMQTPVLDHMIDAWPTAIRLGALLRVDLPDERLEHLLRDPGVSAEAGSAADAAVRERFGDMALEADTDGSSAALDDSLDSAWALWEETAFEQVSGRLRGVGATVLDGNGHLESAIRLTALAVSMMPGSRLEVDAAPDAADRRLVGNVLNHARLWLRSSPHQGRLVTIGTDVDLAEVVRVADATSRINGRPNMVLSARLPGRLLAGYDYGEDDAAALSALPEPVVGIRSLADDGTGADAVWLARLPEPADVAAFVTAWRNRGDLSCCVAATCLVHDEWRQAWLPALRSAGPLIWLVDVGASALAGEFGRGPVHGLYLDLGETPTGVRRAAAFKVTGGAGVWLAVADDVGIELLVAEVAGLPGIDLQMTGGEWSAELPTIRLVLLDLLRFESYFDLRGHTAGVQP